jgi:hypothetical protein
MQKIIGMLAVLLAAQLVLAVGMSFTAPDLTAVRPDTPLLDLGDRSVDRLTIEGPDDQQLVLARQGEDWVLPETGDFPADSSKVDHLLERLKGLKRGLPIATTAGATKRFKVSDDAFERRVLLAQGADTLATLYLGTSPGMRRIHARTDADDAVYAAEFGIYDAPVKSEDWENKSVLQIPPGEIEKLTLSALTLSRLPGTGSGAAAEEGDKQKGGQPGWIAETLGEGETLNQANVDTLVDKLAGLNIAAVLGREEKPEYGLGEPALVLSLQRQGGEAVEYRLGKREAENDYVLKASSRPEYFRLPGYAGEALIKAATREQLVAAAADAANDGAGSTDATKSPPTEGPDETGQSAAQE